MKTITTLLILALLTGCAAMSSTKTSRSISPAQNYRLSDGQPITFHGKIELKRDSNGFTSTDTRTLTVLINGETALHGELHEDYTGDLQGEWNGRRINAMCSSRKRVEQEVRYGRIYYLTYYDAQCGMLIDGEQTVTLTF